MKTLNEQIGELVELIKSLPPAPENRQAELDKKFRLEFNYNSNHLEGNTLTYTETELLLIFDATRGSHTLREYEEMKGHDVAYKLVQELAQDVERPLTESFIKELHEILLVKPYFKEAVTQEGKPTQRKIDVGAYKKYPNSVILPNGEIFHYASPQDTPVRMQELMSWYNEESQKEELKPWELAAIFHHRFVLIHPFDDGNGRMSRLLMNYILLKHSLPPVVIKTKEKKDYLAALQDADSGNLMSFVDYIGNQLLWSLELSLRAASDEEINDPEDWEKKATLLKKKLHDAEGAKQVRSIEVIHELVLFNIFPVMKLLLEKLSVYDDLFAKKDVLFGDSSELLRISTIDEALNIYKEKPSMFLKEARFSYRLHGFNKDGTNTFSADLSLSWDFHDFTYRFYIDHSDYNKAEVKLYGKPLLDPELQEIVNTGGSILYEKIQQSLTRK